MPNTGDLVAAWGTAALNPNFQMIDAMFGGVTTISLGGATTIVLSAPATTGVWVGSVPQANNAMIKFTGTQSGNADIIFPLPGFYLIDNQVTPGDTYSLSLDPGLAGSPGTASISPPQGVVSHVFYDPAFGLKFVNLGVPGSSLDLHGWTSKPRWMLDSVPTPYLLKDGSSYSTVTYPHLAWALRGAFGNSNPPGASFFVPDEMARARIAYDSSNTGRLTSAVSGINGATMGSVGGDQRMQQHIHANSLNDPGHQHPVGSSSTGSNSGGGQQFAGPLPTTVTGTATTGVTITNANVGTGSSQNVQPSIISFLPLIKTVILAGVIVGALNMPPSDASANRIHGAVTAPKFSTDG